MGKVSPGFLVIGRSYPGENIETDDGNTFRLTMDKLVSSSLILVMVILFGAFQCMAQTLPPSHTEPKGCFSSKSQCESWGLFQYDWGIVRCAEYCKNLGYVGKCRYGPARNCPTMDPLYQCRCE